MPSVSTSDDAVAEVRSRTDLVKLVSEHVKLTRRGRDLWGLCPFHAEDSPSFKVNPQMQSWYCFGCERHGDVFTFVELIEKTDFKGALELLAERAGIELRRPSPAAQERRELRRRVLEINRLAARYYEYVLHSTKAGGPGRQLLAERRVSEETARRFQLGFAPGGTGFAGYLRKRGGSLPDAIAAGLLRKDGGDFFQDRLVVPIRDERGQTLAFTGRTVRADENRKYVNSPETPAYVKGRVLFGLDLAREEITRRGQAVLMEGQFDVIVGHQFGVGNAVASSGTALTEDQVRLLKRFTEEVVIAFDGDAAGRAATQKVVEAGSAQGLRTRVVELGGAKDPDEFLRAAGEQAPERWAELESRAFEGWESLIREAVGPSVGDPSQLNAALVRARGVLARIPDQALRERNLELAAGLLGTEPHRLQLRAAPEPSEKPRLGPPPDGKKLTVGRYLLQLLAVRPEAIGRLGTLEPVELDEEDRGTYQRLMVTLKRGGLKALEEDLPGYPEADQSFIRRAWASPPPSVDDATVDDLVRQLRLRRVRNRQSAIIRGLAEAERKGEADQVSALEADLNQVLRDLHELEVKGR